LGESSIVATNDILMTFSAAHPLSLKRRFSRGLSFPIELVLAWVNLRTFMPKFIIERNIPGAGKLDRQQLAAITQASCNVIKSIGPQIQWIESYVTDDKVYCVYIAPDEATIRQHARLGQFPADSVQAVRSVIDPTFA
jgi:hypothetical protein